MGSWKIHMIRYTIWSVSLSRTMQIRHFYRINEQKQK